MRETMRRRKQIATVFCMLAAGMMALVGSAVAAPAEKYLHVNVEDPTKGGSVNVNVPLSMAEKVFRLSTITFCTTARSRLIMRK